MNEEEEKEEISTFLQNVDFYLFTMSVAKNSTTINIWHTKYIVSQQLQT